MIFQSYTVYRCVIFWTFGFGRAGLREHGQAGRRRWFVVLRHGVQSNIISRRRLVFFLTVMLLSDSKHTKLENIRSRIDMGDPRRQQQQTAAAARIISNRATVTAFVTVWPWPFDLWVNACRATIMEYMCTKFGVDSWSHFSLRVQINTQIGRKKERKSIYIAPFIYYVYLKALRHGSHSFTCKYIMPASPS